MGGFGKGDAEEDSHWDLNPGAAAMWVRTRWCGRNTWFWDSLYHVA